MYYRAVAGAGGSFDSTLGPFILVTPSVQTCPEVAGRLVPALTVAREIGLSHP